MDDRSCPSCGLPPADEEASFCIGCGTPLGGSTPAPGVRSRPEPLGSPEAHQGGSDADPGKVR
jgi:hypothetical protein